MRSKNSLKSKRKPINIIMTKPKQTKTTEKLDFSNADLFQKLKRSAPKQKYIYILGALLTIIYQTGLVFSREYSKIYEKTIPENKLYQSSIMNRESLFNTMTQYLDLVIILRSFSSFTLTTIISFIAIVMLGWSLAIINYKRLRQDQNQAESWVRGIFNSKTLESRNSTFIVILSAILMNYDFIFFILNTICFNIPLCYMEEFEMTEGLGQSNYFDENTVVDITVTSQNAYDQSKKTVLLNVLYINNNISCGSFSQYMLVSLAVVIFLCGLQLKIMSLKLAKFTPNPRMYGCKYGNVDLVVDFFINAMILMKSLIYIYYKDNYVVMRFLFYTCFVVVFFCLSLLIKFKPYYNNFYQRLKNFQILYLLFLIGFSILVRETEFKIFRSEVSTLISMMIAFSIFFKISGSVSELTPQQICSEIENISSIEPYLLLNVYYMACLYIEEDVKNHYSGTEKSKRSKQTEMTMIYLLKKHKAKCNKMNCFCQRELFVEDVMTTDANNMKLCSLKSRKIRKLSKLKSQRYDILKTLPIHRNSVLFMKIMRMLFNLSIEKKKCPDIQVFYAYLDLLINYMGVPGYSSFLIKSKMEDMKTKSRDKRFEYPREIKTLLLDLKSVGIRNLSDASLPMSTYNLTKKEFGFVTLKNKLNYRPYDTLLFLNGVNSMKGKISRSIEVKDQFLEELRMKGDLSRLQSLTYKFYLMKKRIVADYKALSEIAMKRYAPLILIYGNYVLNICQNRKVGYKLLTNFWKKMHFTNLNRLFSKNPKLNLMEPCVIQISGEKEDFHKVSYVSFNVYKWLGKEEIAEKI